MDNAVKTRRRSKIVIAEDGSQESTNKMSSNLNGEGENSDGPPVLKAEEDAVNTVVNKAAEETSKDMAQEESDKSQPKKRKRSESKMGEESASEESVGETKEISQQDSPPKLSEKDDSSTNESSDLNLPPKQTLGKGKRARIPNKRYGDILLSPTSRSKPKLGNGERLEKIEPPEQEIFDVQDEELASIPNITSLKSRSNTSSPTSKRPKSSTDISDPKYKKPFLYGWKRELVYRATSDNPNKRSGDIYYYNPAGKKLRSMREITENLKNRELSVDNFTFIKEPLGLDDPEKEIVRDAKAWNKKEPTKPGTRTSKVLSPKVSSVRAPTTSKTTAEPSPVEPPKNKANTRSSSNFKNLQVKLPPSKSKVDKKSKAEEEQMEVETTAPTTKKTPAKKGQKLASKVAAEPPRAKKRATKANSVAERIEEHKAADNFMQNCCYIYKPMMNVFQYLKVQDLLRAGCVCSLWRDMTNNPSLWKTVRMKNSQVHSFDGLANTLQKHGTVHLDLRKMLLPLRNDDEIWPEFSKAIQKVQTLRNIELCRCPASVVEQLAVTNKDLEMINAVTIKCESLSIDMLSSLRNLKELRLKSPCGLVLSSDITSLKELTNLSHLSLTSVKDLHTLNLNVIAALSNLESLDLGECTDFPKNFGEEILVKLKKLAKLRLEKGQGNCHTFEILDAVKNMPQLEQLELVNFDIKTGFDVALGGCKNVKKLLIIPTYISQSATTNHVVLGGVLRLQSTLSHFVWGVTLELLRVTELFVDQCEDPDKKDKKEKRSGNGDNIPVLKPVPSITDKDDTIPPAYDPPQVEILPLPNLQKLLLQSLPTTRVKILKIPFHATWRQGITDTVN